MAVIWLCWALGPQWAPCPPKFAKQPEDEEAAYLLRNPGTFRQRLIEKGFQEKRRKNVWATQGCKGPDAIPFKLPTGSAIHWQLLETRKAPKIRLELERSSVLFGTRLFK